MRPREREQERDRQKQERMSVCVCVPVMAVFIFLFCVCGWVFLREQVREREHAKEQWMKGWHVVHEMLCGCMKGWLIGPVYIVHINAVYSNHQPL